MKLSKDLKKILVSSAALLMFASVGTSASNVSVSARHVRIHRTYHKHVHHSRTRRGVRRWNHKRNVHKYNVHKLAHRRNVRNWRHYKKYHHTRKTVRYHDFNPFHAPLSSWEYLNKEMTTPGSGKLTGYSPQFIKDFETGNKEFNLGHFNPKLEYHNGYATYGIYFEGVGGFDYDGSKVPVRQSDVNQAIQAYKYNIKNPKTWCSKIV